MLRGVIDRSPSSVLPLQTPTDEVPMCLLNFQGHLIAGVGKALRLYELGRKQLLRKCENNVSVGHLSCPRTRV